MDIQFVAFRDASEDAGRASWPLPPLQMKHDAPIRESQLIHSCKEFAEGLTERGFGNVCIDGVAAAQQLLKLGVTWRYPFEDEVLCRQAAAQGGDAIHWDLVAKQKMVQHRQHHHRVKMSGRAAEEGGVFAILPSRSGRWMSEIDAQGEDVPSTSLEVGAQTIDSLQVGIDRNHFGAGV